MFFQLVGRTVGQVLLVATELLEEPGRLMAAAEVLQAVLGAQEVAAEQSLRSMTR